MENQTDQELVSAALRGQDAAFEALVRRHQDAVFGLAMSMTRNREDAADMTQEAFIRAYEKLEQYNPAYGFRPWLLRICANRTKNLFRRRVRRREIEQKHYEQTETAKEGVPADFSALQEALETLPEKLRLPLYLKYVEQLPYEEVSSILGIGISAAKMRVSRAKSLLMERWKK